MFLETFRLPGESQVIYRIMEHFSDHFYKAAEGGPFLEADAVFVLSYSTIMLNVDLHNENVKNKMSIDQFCKANKAINKGGDLPRETLEEIYYDIGSNQLKVVGEEAVNSLLDGDFPLSFVNDEGLWPGEPLSATPIGLLVGEAGDGEGEESLTFPALMKLAMDTWPHMEKAFSSMVTAMEVFYNPPSLLLSLPPCLLASLPPWLLGSLAPWLLCSLALWLLGSLAPWLLPSFPPSLLPSFPPSLLPSLPFSPICAPTPLYALPPFYAPTSYLPSSF